MYWYAFIFNLTVGVLVSGVPQCDSKLNDINSHLTKLNIVLTSMKNEIKKQKEAVEQVEVNQAFIANT